MVSPCSHSPSLVTSWHHFTPIPLDAAFHTLVHSSAVPFNSISLHSSSHFQSRSLLHLHYPVKSTMHSYTPLSLHHHQLPIPISFISAPSHPMQHHHTLLSIKFTLNAHFPSHPFSLLPPSLHPLPPHHTLKPPQSHSHPIPATNSPRNALSSFPVSPFPFPYHRFI